MNEEVTYAGTECPGCDWMGDDPRVEQCPHCGRGLRFWATNDFDLVPKSWPYSVLPDEE